MTKETKEWIIIGAVFLGIIVLFALSIDHQKTKCLADGGKWVSGIVANQFVVFLIPEDNIKPVEPKSNFEVVDNYKGCDVVRWTNNQLAEYKYFLNCNNTLNYPQITDEI